MPTTPSATPSALPSPAPPAAVAGARPRTQIFFASTLYGAATLAAALDAGLFAPAHRRLLMVANNAAIPETTPALDETPGFERLRERFDAVLSWNETIRPFHPGGWSPRADDIPLWERYLRLLWKLEDDEIELAVESIQVNPALAVARLFPGAPLTVYADGLMSYGPTRNKLDPLVGTRVDRLLHLDLVPGLEPLLLAEFGVPSHIVPSDRFTDVLAEIAAATAPLEELKDLERHEGSALLLGQYLSALDILTPQEEEESHIAMVRGAAARGHRAVLFKPHPSAPARWSRLLEREAEALGVTLSVLDSPVLAEVVYQRARPALVVGCFSTALLTATSLYRLPVARIGTELLLERLTPYQNSNRVPVTLVDALLPDVTDIEAAPTPRDIAPAELTGLVTAVGYAMQHRLHPGLRAAAERYLSHHLDADTRRYFKRRRLTALALPGALPSQLSFIPRNATVRRVARRARAVQRRLKKRAVLG